jgi:hypothetical protein
VLESSLRGIPIFVAGVIAVNENPDSTPARMEHMAQAGAVSSE